MFWSDLGNKLIFMLSCMAHSTYLYCVFDVIHNDFKLADQKTSFSYHAYGHEFLNVVIFNNALNPRPPPPPLKLNLNKILNALTLLNKGGLFTVAAKSKLYLTK